MVFFGKRSDAVKSKAGAKNNTAGRRGEKFSRTHPNCHRRRGGGLKKPPFGDRTWRGPRWCPVTDSQGLYLCPCCWLFLRLQAMLYPLSEITGYKQQVAR